MKKLFALFPLLMSLMACSNATSSSQSSESQSQSTSQKTSQNPSQSTSRQSESSAEVDYLEFAGVPGGYSAMGVIEDKVTDWNIIIPDTYEGEPVVEVGDSGFMDCEKLLSVSIPASVWKVCDNAFLRCENLQRVTLRGESALTTIKRSAFEGCTKLETITIPSLVTRIEAEAFAECTSLTSATLEFHSLTRGMPGRLFYNCTSLNNIVFKGTKAEWNDLFKYGEITEWADNVPATVVHCSDGDVAIEKTPEPEGGNYFLCVKTTGWEDSFTTHCALWVWSEKVSGIWTMGMTDGVHSNQGATIVFSFESNVVGCIAVRCANADQLRGKTDWKDTGEIWYQSDTLTFDADHRCYLNV